MQDSPMTRRVDEVEAAVYTVVDDVSPVQTRLVCEIALELVVYVLDDGLEAGGGGGGGWRHKDRGI